MLDNPARRLREPFLRLDPPEAVQKGGVPHQGNQTVEASVEELVLALQPQRVSYLGSHRSPFVPCSHSCTGSKGQTLLDNSSFLSQYEEEELSQANALSAKAELHH